MLAIVRSCHHWCLYLNGARHPVEVWTDHHNLQRLMTTKSLTGRQARWWEMLSGYNLNIVYRAGKKNPANASSCRQDYARAPEGRCAAMILTVRCNATFRLRQLYAAAVQEDQIFKDVPPDTLADLILEGQAEDHTAKEACTALGLPGGYLAEEHSISATLLRQYQSHWQQHDGLIYYRMQLYVRAAGGACTEVLRRHHDDPIAAHFGAKRTLELVARKYYWPGMARKVKAYTRACSTCQRVRPVWHRLHGNMEPLPQLRDPWTDILVDIIVGLPVSCRKRHAKPHNAIHVAVNWYTQLAHYFPCHDTLDAVGLAKILTRKLMLRGAGVS